MGTSRITLSVKHCRNVNKWGAEGAGDKSYCLKSSASCRRRWQSESFGLLMLCSMILLKLDKKTGHKVDTGLRNEKMTKESN